MPVEKHEAGKERLLEVNDLHVSFFTPAGEVHAVNGVTYHVNQEEVVAGFQQLVQAAEDAGHSEILDRVIVQNQHNEFKHWVEKFYPFENWLYTFYSIPNEEDRQPENLASYCEREGIPVLTMWEYMPNEEWFETMEPHDIKIFVHTVNDAAQANELIAAGVTGIYTDSITPDQIPPTGW
ncbi:MAG: hypothetical protein HFG63_13955 [Lachnospiraceae bacterium]|nr:hypothetical protein [Lachnospiraceae bacterium]